MEIHLFYTAKPDWSNLEVLHKNELPPRASFFPFSGSEDALTHEVSRSSTICLSGKWKFHYATSPFRAPQDFQNADFSVAEWHDIQVPGMWQLQGFGKPQYTNEAYPFPVDPPNSIDRPLDLGQCRN
jgi:beta-galactosidase